MRSPSILTTSAMLALSALLGGTVGNVWVPAIAQAQDKAPNTPKANPFLAAEKYATTHFDSAQTDAFP